MNFICLLSFYGNVNNILHNQGKEKIKHKVQNTIKYKKHKKLKKVPTKLRAKTRPNMHGEGNCDSFVPNLVCTSVESIE